MQDLEGNPITALVSDSSGNGIPPYVTITSTSIIFKATSYASIGTYPVVISLSDGEPLSSNYTFSLTISNSAPTFASYPANFTLANNGFLTYTIPASSDAEGNQFTITLGPSAITWASLSGNTLQISMPPVSSTGTNNMTLRLSDGNAVRTYNFTVDVTNSPPAFAVPPPSS
jgi:hypothetical protein